MASAFAFSPERAGAVELLDERRREPRVPVGAIPARLRTEEGAETHAAHVLDISTSGLRVRLDARLKVGAEATIWFDRTVATGQIRYCRASEAGAFEAGLCLTDVLNIV